LVKETQEANIWVTTQDTESEISISICDNDGGISQDYIEEYHDKY